MRTVKLDKGLKDWLRAYEMEEDLKFRRGDYDVPLYYSDKQEDDKQ